MSPVSYHWNCVINLEKVNHTVIFKIDLSTVQLYYSIKIVRHIQHTEDPSKSSFIFPHYKILMDWCVPECLSYGFWV